MSVLPQFLLVDGVGHYIVPILPSAEQPYRYCAEDGCEVQLDVNEIQQCLSVMYNTVDLGERIQYSRHNGYECSSKGDGRFSAFSAIMPDGRSIEQWYQCGALDGRGKQFQPGGTDWKLGKGKPWLAKSRDQLYQDYYSFWDEWAQTHRALMVELHYRAAQANYLLRDTFATSTINQARALAQWLNENPWDGEEDLFQLRAPQEPSVS